MSRVRIVGGEWRSRLLPVLELPGLRPTPDRVRETLFNWLGQELDGLRCLDLFAGTGILGFEAASRGAARVTMLEKDRRAAAQLEQSRKTLQATQVEIVRGDALEFAAGFSGEAYDLVFLDPPYRLGLIDRLIPSLDRLAAADGWLYVEAEHEIASLGEWRRLKGGRAGQVHYQLMRKGQA